MLQAAQSRLAWRLGEEAPDLVPVRWPMPGPETLALAAGLDRLRQRRPRWWLQVDDLSRWAAERAEARQDR
jgi:hypothetical protein